MNENSDLDPRKLAFNLLDITDGKKSRKQIHALLDSYESIVSRAVNVGPRITRAEMIVKIAQLEAKNQDGKYTDMIIKGKWRVATGPVVMLLREHLNIVNSLRSTWTELGLTREQIWNKTEHGRHISLADIRKYMAACRPGVALEDYQKGTEAAERIRSTLIATGFDMAKYDNPL